MTATDPDQLYALLPAFVRLRDRTEGNGVLRALIGVLAEQAQAVSAGLDQLYDDQFVETCAPWVLPYIGDLIGYTPLRPLGANGSGATRGDVASTIGDRRRKGTLAMLEQLCADVTQATVTDDQGVERPLAGWPGVGVEYFSRLATTQYVRSHLRPGNAIVDVRSPMTAVDRDSAFDLPPRTADVRRISSRRGRYNIMNIGLFVWRLAPYDNVGRPARRVGVNRYTFDPFGGDVPLVNRPVAASAGFELTRRENLPFFLQRYPLYAGVEPYATEPPHQPPVAVSVGGSAVPLSAISWCDLTDWTAPTASGIEAAVDPVLGRLVFASAPAAAAPVLVDYAYAYSGDYGGGPYLVPVAPDEAAVEAGIAHQTISGFAGAALESTLGPAVIEISDSAIRSGAVDLNPGTGHLVVRAGPRQRPVLAGDLGIVASKGATVTLRGIGVDGRITVSGAGPLTVRLEHCTVRGGVDWSDASVTGSLTVDHSLCGPIVADPAVSVDLRDSAVDAGSDTAPAVAAAAGAAAGELSAARCTVVGAIAARRILVISDSIVTGSVTAAERQAGCVRYSYVPLTGSTTPRRFRCQPDREVDAAVARALRDDPALTASQRTAIQSAIEAWLRPAFTSRAPGHPGYLQLAEAAPDQIVRGAEQENEMGVFYGLYSPTRESNLARRVAEYLRIGLEAGIFHAT
jgi:hypothetical protein